MDPTAEQVLALRGEGMSDADIAEATGLELAVVRAVSEKRGEAIVRVTPEVAREMLDGIVELARGAESDFVKLQARKYVVDDFKGRLDKAPAAQINITLTEINKAVAASRTRILERAQAAGDVEVERRGLLAAGAVEVESVEVEARDL